MGCSAREKHARANRKIRSTRPEVDHSSLYERASIPKSSIDSGLKPLGFPVSLKDAMPGSISSSISSSNANPIAEFDDHQWAYCSEDQLEEILMMNLGYLYQEAKVKLIALGYPENTVTDAILKNGDCFGGMDVLTNILHNTLAYLNDGPGSEKEKAEEHVRVFTNLKDLKVYSLAGMVKLLQTAKPHWSKGDAMWCLLVSDLHVGRAMAMEFPKTNSAEDSSTPVQNKVDVSNNEAIPPALRRFHGGSGFGNRGGTESPVINVEMKVKRDLVSSHKFNISPVMKSILKRNAAAFASVCRGGSRLDQTQFHAHVPNSSDDAQSTVPADENQVENCEESRKVKKQDRIDSVLAKLSELNLDTEGEDHKEIMTLVNQIKDLQKQVEERKEWAHQKAMQAARKLSKDLTEIKMLKAEKDETQRLNMEKMNLEDSTMKRLSEMEHALRMASGQVDRANAAVRRLEIENAEIRAELEASKLSTAESVATCLEIAKREKKCLKKILAWEKQKSKLQEEISAEKEKIKELRQCLIQIEDEKNETEALWRQELQAKQLASLEVEEERCSKLAADSRTKRRIDSLHQKIEIDFKRHKDDIRRLEDELSRLKESEKFLELTSQPASPILGNSAESSPQIDTIAELLHELELEDSSGQEFNCLMCKKNVVAVVFLPCSHQVICTSCNDVHVRQGGATCLSCWTPITERIHVFGTSS